MRRLLGLFAILVSLFGVSVLPVAAEKTPPPATPTEKPASVPQTPTPKPPIAGATPTRNPPSSSTPASSPTETPMPVIEPTVPTPTPVTAPTVTSAITPTVTSSTPGREDRRGSDIPPTPEPSPIPIALTPSVRPAPAITVCVFDDRNDDSAQDPSEPGVPGVPVLLNGQVVGETDTDGCFSLPLPDEGRARLTIRTPEGFEWLGGPIIIAEGVSDVAIPLRQAGLKGDLDKDVVKMVATTAVGGAAIIALLIGMILNGFASLTQAAAVRSLERTFRRQKSLELELTMTQDVTARLDDLREHLSSSSRAWREIAGQLLLDAGVATAEEIVLNLDEASVLFPHFAISAGGNRYLFTTDPSQARRRDHVVPLDAATVSPFARIEAHALWAHLTGQDVSAVALFRNVAWYVVVHNSSGWNWDPKKWTLKGLSDPLARMGRHITYMLVGLLALGVVAFAGIRLYQCVVVASLFNAGRNTVELKAGSDNFTSAAGEEATSTPVPSPPPTVVATPTATATPVTTIAVATTMPVTHTAGITATIAGTGGALLRVRAQPGGEVLGHLAEGTQVFVLEESVLQEGVYWHLVQMPGDMTGWVARDYIVFGD